jgi:hypothetical protein
LANLAAVFSLNDTGRAFGSPYIRIVLAAVRVLVLTSYGFISSTLPNVRAILLALPETLQMAYILMVAAAVFADLTETPQHSTQRNPKAWPEKSKSKAIPIAVCGGL